MLELKSITKVYPSAGEDVHALRGVDLRFRNNEFVSVLGPSGCGKTTLLNIIGGLDRYTSGDLQIGGVSTKQYRDRDWDAYRNHSIGFVFQSYNLIPHQTVLSNVELSMTLSGVGKKERRERAVEALKKVGLEGQIHKRPAQMSGGQMQRVAIARAIVNNPDIVLADEPTGALDTETGIQVMEILKEIAKDRLVIMVTHNPELAEQYSTRIVRMLDGKVTSDTCPVTDEEAEKLVASDREKAAAAHTRRRREKMPSMSLWTSFGLSLRNLITKKGRTALTSFAGSIGIIGIALIYAVSQGTTNYIGLVQEDTLSSYPISLQAQTVSLDSLLQTFAGSAESVEKHDNDAIYQKTMLYELMSAYSNIETKENDLGSFKAFLERERADENSRLHDTVSGVQYSYRLDLPIYTQNVDGAVIHSDSNELISDMMSTIYGVDVEQMGGTSSMGSASMSTAMLWQEMLPGTDGTLYSDLLKQQYDMIYGTWPSAYNEVLLVVDENNELSDLSLFALGLTSKDEVKEILTAALKGENVHYTAKKWSYEDICAHEYRVILSSDCYEYDEATDTYVDMRRDEVKLSYLYDKALVLHVCGIIRPSESAVASMLSGSVAYTSALTNYIIEHTNASPAIAAQNASPERDVLTGRFFREDWDRMSPQQRGTHALAYVASLPEAEKAQLYVSMLGTPSEEQTKAAVDAALDAMSRDDIVDSLTAMYMMANPEYGEEMIRAYIGAMTDEALREMMRAVIAEQVAAEYAAQVAAELAAATDAELAARMDEFLEVASRDTATADVMLGHLVPTSDMTKDRNLRRLGYVDLDAPASINIYTTTFADKDVIEDEIAKYNDSVDEMQKIEYTDFVKLLMSSVTTIINAISYVLIGFVSVSLIVSSIMIGVITLISVQERTKEIGILRATGASKKNVSGLFNAETVMIGLFSGVIGCCVTWLLCLPINLLLHALTDIETLSAVLPLPVAGVLTLISVLLTLIAGIIPSRSAAKKDPVIALRTE